MTAHPKAITRRVYSSPQATTRSVAVRRTCQGWGTGRGGGAGRPSRTATPRDGLVGVLRGKAPDVHVGRPTPGRQPEPVGRQRDLDRAARGGDRRRPELQTRAARGHRAAGHGVRRGPITQPLAAWVRHDANAVRVRELGVHDQAVGLGKRRELARRGGQAAHVPGGGEVSRGSKEVQGVEGKVSRNIARADDRSRDFERAEVGSGVLALGAKVGSGVAQDPDVGDHGEQADRAQRGGDTAGDTDVARGSTAARTTQTAPT